MITIKSESVADNKTKVVVTMPTGSEYTPVFKLLRQLYGDLFAKSKEEAGDEASYTFTTDNDRGKYFLSKVVEWYSVGPSYTIEIKG